MFAPGDIVYPDVQFLYVLENGLTYTDTVSHYYQNHLTIAVLLSQSSQENDEILKKRNAACRKLCDRMEFKTNYVLLEICKSIYTM